MGKKIQLSCFDISLKASNYHLVKFIPSEKDYTINLVETRSGVPHPTTGVLPAFFTLKWSKGIGKPNLDIEIAKPTKFNVSITICNYILDVQKKILAILRMTYKDGNSEKQNPQVPTKEPIDVKTQLKTQKSIENYSKFKQIKEQLHGISVFHIKMSQIVFAIRTEVGNELTLSVAKIKDHLNVSNRPERITNVISIESITFGITTNGISRLVLNPWTVSIEVCLFWESWQSIDSNPQIQISAESDCVMLDISPEQLQCIELIQKEIKEFTANLSSDPSNVEDTIEDVTPKVPPSDKEQHYKDDLRAGAFHFVDSASNNIDELPLPYQVMSTVNYIKWIVNFIRICR